MGLSGDGLKVESWGVKKEKEGKKKKIENDVDKEEEMGCCIHWRLMGGCVPSRSKVDSLVSQLTVISLFFLNLVLLFALLQSSTESKATNDTSRDQPVVTEIPSTTTSHAESGFGCVFKGWIEVNGRAPVKPGTGLTVSVKTLNHDGLQGHKEWLAEVSFLGNLIHPNLVNLVGYCIEDDQRLLVYEFMPRGSLENHLFRRSLPLPWSIRMKIALGPAKGLAFLHEEAARPEYNAKLSDFGLAKDGPEGDKTHVSTRVMGTYGYAAPEYVMTGHVTSKSDVDSFDVVLLEMMTCKRSMGKTRPNGEQNLVEWARPYLSERRKFHRLIDPKLEGHFSIKGAQKAAQLAACCLSRDLNARPLTSDVVAALEPLPNLEDMVSSSYYFQTVQTKRVGSSPNTRNGIRTQGAAALARNGQRSLSIPNGSYASPYDNKYPHDSPKPKGKS
ncbi:hypothetical protein LIER_27975 [Lithospermum erythrorhizon]|uniref:Protein kinase domain-containing protein n=1 Tax=Lithospermum erythrorhizon TaxID=34254 RepID=A0AAV3RF36_LITER